MTEGSDFYDYASHFTGNYTVGELFAFFANASCYRHVYSFVPKGVDASTEKDAVYGLLSTLGMDSTILRQYHQ